MTCPECGHRNAPGAAFCAACEAFLDWGDREPPVTGESPRAGASADAGDTRGTGAPDGGSTPAAPAPDPAARVPDPPAHAPSTPGPAPRPSPTPPPTPPDTAAPRRPGDDRLTTSVPGPEEEPEAPAPQPGPVPRRPDAGAGVPCPNCRTVNGPERRLCRHCGLRLDPGPPPETPPTWWRRLLDRRRRRPLPAAGTRPRRRLWRRPSLAIPITLVALALAVWFARPYFSEVFDVTRDNTGTPDELHPSATRGSSAAPGHPAGAAFDTYTNRYWVPARPGPGKGEFIECDFEKPARMLKLVVFSGRSAKEDEFLTEARPAALNVTLRSEDGTITRKKITLKDRPGQQTFDVRGTDVVRVRLAVDGVHGGADGRRPAIAEAEFFGRP